MIPREAFPPQASSSQHSLTEHACGKDDKIRKSQPRISILERFSTEGQVRKMQWSQLKKRAEGFICASLQKELEFHSTRYQRAHDHTGRCWVTVEKREIFQACTVTWEGRYYGLAAQIRQMNQCQSYTDPQQREGYYRAYTDAETILHKQGIYAQHQFISALEEWTNISLEKALNSENALIRALALIDKRLGKRRLKQLHLSTDEHPLIRLFYELRRNAEAHV